MKIRIKGNSIRFRLTRTDMTNFEKEGFLEERTEFPNGTIFYYVLQHTTETEAMNADYSDNTITIQVPDHIAAQWTGTEIVGFSHEITLPTGRILGLLIEKDFACLDHSKEDQSDMYVNPNREC